MSNLNKITEAILNGANIREALVPKQKFDYAIVLQNTDGDHDKEEEEIRKARGGGLFIA